ncbi:MAG: redoxin domain-containing protein [Deltaproteobacteria bacterium]|nr:redoxin domain-containing protein [Deltaproteobacteria bacterium]
MASTPTSGTSAPVAEDANQATVGTGGGIIESDATVASKADAGSGGADGEPTTGPVFNPDIGSSCAITGACPEGLSCIGGASKDSAQVYCTVQCAADQDCPERFACTKQGVNPDKTDKKLCTRRDFCSPCANDAQCGPGGRCIAMGTDKFCSRSCNLGHFECPRYAECLEVAEGGAACVHNSGSCLGDGSLCAACGATDNCATKDGGAGGMCLTYNHTKEQFCSAPCEAGDVCLKGYGCVGIGASKSKQCVPSDKTAPKCVPKLNKHIEEGDILDDFAMVGFLDTDGDGSLLATTTGNEEPRIIKLSEYADLGFKVVLLNVAAGWCGPCKQETTTFKSLLAKYPDLGIYQVLYDGTQQGSMPTLQLAKDWIKSFKGQGAVGVDPDRNVAPINVAGSTPLNLVIDAKTRKVLKKVNGLPATGVGGIIAPFMK